jgi:spermidine synthase
VAREFKNPDFLTEHLNPDAGLFVRGGTLLEAGTTAFQRYEVWDTPQFGKLFRLDGCFMTSERDEFFYHENLVHVAAVAHSGPRSALVIGGGDGGSARQLLKHRGMARVVLVELDAKVVEIARTYLHAVHQGALDDPRLALRIGDGLEYVRAGAGGERFDLIVLDLTDPVGPAAALYTDAFFAACKALLRPEGALSLHLGAPDYQKDRLLGVLRNLRAVFAKVEPYFLFVPLYGSLWGMACASDAASPSVFEPKDVELRLRERGIGALQYYNGEVHRAQFALPNYLRVLLA